MTTVRFLIFPNLLDLSIEVLNPTCYNIAVSLKGPHLIIVPKTTVENWVSEFKKFCPTMVVICLKGDKDERVRLGGLYIIYIYTFVCLFVCLL